MLALGWIYFISLLLILFVLLYKYTSRNYDYWKKQNVEYVKPFPFFGSILPLFMMKTTMGEWLWELSNSMGTDYFGLYVFDQPALVVQAPKLVKSILVKDFQYFEDRVGVMADDPIMDNIIFFKKSPSWKPTRAKLSPIFTSGKLKLMFPLILNEGKEMVEYLKGLIHVENVEAKEISGKYAVNVIARCAFAVNANSFKNEDAEFRSIAREMFGFRVDTAMRQIGSWFTPNIIKTFKIQFFSPHIISSLKRMFTDVLHSRINSQNLKGNDLIDLLIETNRKNDGFFTDDAMVGHAIQFFAAGFETVSSTLAFALYELAIHPEIQEKLRNEIKEHTAKEADITYNEILDMKYMDMVICETLRKYPVLPFLDRLCKSDYKVEGTDLVIKKGTPIFIPMFGLHYDPKHFPDPMKFDPERFADKTKINNNEMYYVPFGEGPRVCIGERFGLMGVKIGLTSILKNYKVEKSSKTPSQIEFEPKSFVLQSKVGIPIKFVPC